jgi:hypothetical protein
MDSGRDAGRGPPVGAGRARARQLRDSLASRGGSAAGALRRRLRRPTAGRPDDRPRPRELGLGARRPRARLRPRSVLGPRAARGRAASLEHVLVTTGGGAATAPPAPSWPPRLRPPNAGLASSCGAPIARVPSRPASRRWRRSGISPKRSRWQTSWSPGAGQTALEAAASATAAVVVVLVDNQQRQAEALRRHGAALVVAPW